MDTDVRPGFSVGTAPTGPNTKEVNTMSTANTTTHTLLRAEGFSCPSCVNKIEKQVGRMKGVEKVKVHFASARVEVDHDEATASVDDIIAVIAKAGYKAAASAF